MSYFSYITFPRKVDTSCLDSDLFGIEILDIYMFANLDGIFTNPFVYNLEGRFDLLDDKELLRSYKEIYEQNETEWSEAELLHEVRAVMKANNDNVILCRSQLYDIAKLNLEPNETIEIYTGWLGNDDSEFNHLKSSVEIDVEDILTSKLLDLSNETKLVIKRSR